MLKESAFYRGGYHSVLGSRIEEYMHQKREKGVMFARGSWYLRIFDRYCTDKDLKTPVLTRMFIDGWLCSFDGFRTEHYRRSVMCVVRGFATFLNTIHGESALVPMNWRNPYKNRSAMAGFIDEFIEAKRKQSYSYRAEARELQSFDRYCHEQKLNKAEEITPSFINAWHRMRKTVQKGKDYRYLIRDFCIHLRAVKGFSMEIGDRRFKEAHPAENYRFQSAFAYYLQDFVTDKHRSGLKYESERKILKYFDLLCLEKELKEPVLGKALVHEWSVQKPSEGSVYRNKRVSIIRQFACFLISRGNDAYVAPKSPHAESEKPHVFKIEEVEAVFRCADHLPLELPYMRLTVPVIFRFYYCLGLRLNEAIGLERNDVDLSTGKVTIRMAKCLKDRVVYLPDDLRELAGLYDSRIAETVSDRALFFVSDVLGTKINDTGLCKIFNLAWTATGFAESADKKPTIHSFRHTFVVRKLEEWYSKKVDYTYWLPYLSTHLGHSTLEDTYSYIHLVDSVFPQIRDSMGVFERLYPEVDR